VSAPSKTPDALDRIAEQLEERGLRPLIDRDMDLVVADCPECRAGDADPLGIWRPLMVTRRDGTLRFQCAACEAGVIRHAA
jgi:hypothetical protein